METLARLGWRTSLYRHDQYRSMVSLRIKVDLHNHLLAGEEAVGDEFAGPDGDLRVSHDCGVCLSRGGCCRNGT